MKKWIVNRLPDAHRRYLWWVKDHLGTRVAFLSYLGFLLRGNGLVRLPSAAGKVWLRMGTTDLDVYNGTFVLRTLEPLGGNAKFVVDAGGHIGLTALFLANRFPSAVVVVVEPDADNFQLLKRNVKHRRNIIAVHAGLWRRDTTLSIVNPGDSPWEFRVAEGAGSIRAVTIESLMQMTGETYIDVLKIDIEGSEIEVLEASGPWIDRVGALAIELHDRFRPGCMEALDKATSGRGFTRSTSGEYHVLVRS